MKCLSSTALKELKTAGADEVIFEYEHGDAKTKKQLQMLLDIAKEGDTIITLEVSRLSRSTQQLCELIEIIRAKQLRLVIVGSITIDCRNGETDPMSEAFLQMAGVFSQLELAMIRVRVKSGILPVNLLPLTAMLAVLFSISSRKHRPPFFGNQSKHKPYLV